MRKKTLYIELFVLFALSLLPLMWLKPGEVVMGHDSGFRINFLSYYKSLLFAWNPVMNFGIDWQLYKGFLMTQFPEFVFTILTGSWVTGQRMMMVFWFFLMQLSMYILVNSIQPGKKHWVFRLGASIFYAYNFFILQAWFIVERAKFSLYAALPIAVLLMYLVFEKNKPVLRYALYFGLLYFIASGGGSPPLYGASLVVWTVTYLYFAFREWKARRVRGLLFALRVGCLFGVSFFLFNAYWIIPQIGLYLSTYSSAVASRGGIDGLIAWERVTSLHASLYNLIRLQGIPDWYDNPANSFAAAYRTNPLLIAVSWIPFLAVVAGVLISLIQKKKLPSILVLTVVLLGIGLVLAGGSHPPFGIFFEYAMRHIPGFAIFRSSFYKFGPVVWFSMIFLSLYFINAFLVEGIKHRGIRVPLGICVVVGILVYHYPFFSAPIFRFHNEFTTKVNVPSYVGRMADYVNTRTDPNARIMILPELTSSFYNVQMDAYTWNFFSLDILPRNAITRSIIANDTNAPDTIFRLYTEFMDGTPEAFLTLARYAGVRYILWRDDAKYSSAVTEGRTIAFQRSRMAYYAANKVYEVGAWQLYDLGNGETPLVWAPQQAAVTQRAVFHPLELLLKRESSDSAVIEGTALQETVFEATCVYCELGVYDKMVRETPLPRLRFKPGTLLYPRVLSADARAIAQAGTNPEAVFNAYISHSQLQLAILSSTIKPAGYDENRLAEDIAGSFRTALQKTRELSGRQKNVYATRLLLYLDVSGRFVDSIPSLRSETKDTLLAAFETARSEIVPDVWMTRDPSDIKYEFEISSEGAYRFLVTGVQAAPESIEIDGVAHPESEPVILSSGYHTARIFRPRTSRGFAPQLFLQKFDDVPYRTPEITWVKVSPTAYHARITGATGPFILILNETFDKRWKVSYGIDSVQIDETNHGKANGFANAWVISRTGDYTVRITYSPQRLFSIGAAITIMTVLAAVYIIRK